MNDAMSLRNSQSTAEPLTYCVLKRVSGHGKCTLSSTVVQFNILCTRRTHGLREVYIEFDLFVVVQIMYKFLKGSQVMRSVH